MKIPNPGIYRKNAVTWPCSATPDYAGEVGLIIHDGAFPFWKNSLGQTDELAMPDPFFDQIDQMYSCAKLDNAGPCKEKRFQNGMAIYGHLVDGHFFARFLLDLDVAKGRKSTQNDLAMDRALLYRTMQNSFLLNAEYAGNIWLAPSVPVYNDPQFGRMYARWQGKKSVPAADIWNYPSVPRVTMNGALLTNGFVPWDAKHPISVRPDPSLSNEDMFL